MPSALPLLDERPPVKPADRAARRVLCLEASLSVTCGHSRVYTLWWLRDNGLQADVTARELDHILHGPDEPDEFARGCAESGAVLRWALQAVPDFDPASPELDLENDSESTVSCEDAGVEPSSAVGFRCTEELLQQRDRIFCLHGITLDAPAPGRLQTRIGALAVRWRWLAFEWLFSDSSWEALTRA